MKNLSFKYTIFSLIGVLLAMCFVSCEKKPSEVQTTDVLSQEVKSNLITLRDSVFSLRKKAFASEQEKLKSTQALIDEIETTFKNYDAALINSLKEQHKQMEAALYDTVTMGDEAVMDKYDLLTSHVIASLQKIGSEPDFKKYARANVLLEAVLAADSDDFMLRKDYNSAALAFNHLLTQYQTALDKAEEPFKSMTKAILFWGEASVEQ
jgi:hypothetical protein